MTATVLPLDGDAHHAVQTLLPWYASGRLDAGDAATIEQHLAGCASCRAELGWDMRLLQAHAATAAAIDDGAVEQGLARLRRRIDAAAPAPSTAPSTAPPAAPAAAARPRRWRSGSATRGVAVRLRWVVGALLGAQFVTIAVLATWLAVPAAPPPAYHALGRPGAAPAGNAVVRFRPDASEQDIRRALRSAGARVVDGPTVTDAYVLSLPAADPAAALAGLRADPHIVLAESLEPGPGR